MTKYLLFNVDPNTGNPRYIHSLRMAGGCGVYASDNRKDYEYLFQNYMENPNNAAHFTFESDAVIWKKALHDQGTEVELITLDEAIYKYNENK